jgi:hypothetical protein
MQTPRTDTAALTPAAPAAPPGGRGVLCPACGYDLRAATGNRCSECGLVIDLTALGRTSIPWAYRRAVGRVRAFLKTVWLITVDARSLRHEAAKPHSAGDGVTFRRWVTVPVAAGSVGLSLLLISLGAIEDAVVQQAELFRFRGIDRVPTGFEQDFLVPWSAGVALRPALFGYAVLVAVYVSGAPGPIFRRGGMPSGRAEAARAMGDYAAAPLVWLLPATATFAAAAWLSGELDGSYEESRFFPAVAGAGWLLAVLGLGGAVYRTGQWRARVTRRGYATGFSAMGELLLRWVVGVAVLLCVVPWCVGFLWIVIDSFRL